MMRVLDQDIGGGPLVGVTFRRLSEMKVKVNRLENVRPKRENVTALLKLRYSFKQYDT